MNIKNTKCYILKLIDKLFLPDLLILLLKLIQITPKDIILIHIAIIIFQIIQNLHVI